MTPSRVGLVLVLAAAALLCPAGPVSAKPKAGKARSGKGSKPAAQGPVHLIRLTHGPSADKGRLEVFPNKDFRSQSWMPFCDSLFEAQDAQLVCELMGYKFGRKYYSDEVTYTADAAEAPRRLQGLECAARAGRRKLLSDSDDDSIWSVLADNQHESAGGQSGSGSDRNTHTVQLLPRPGTEQLQGAGQRRRTVSTARSLLALDDAGEYEPFLRVQPQSGIVGIIVPPKAARQCTFRTSSSCGPDGPLAGVECSDKRFGPAPPPAPPVPSPPPPPPAKDGFIRFFQAAIPVTASFAQLESNLCDANGGGDCSFGRAELLVANPAKPDEMVWAPLCAVNSATFPDYAADVARKACHMLYDYPASRMSGLYSPHPFLGPALALPTGVVSGEGLFDPASVPLWAELPDPALPESTLTGKRLIQDVTGLRVSSTACSTGALFAFRCDEIVTRRR